MTSTRGLTISQAAAQLGTSPRMLRYREALGLLPPAAAGVRHRRYGPAELAAAAAAIALEERYDVSPRTLAFALRAVAEPDVAADLRALGERTGRIPPAPTRALDFAQRKALRLLRP
jgi:hypothetical protein